MINSRAVFALHYCVTGVSSRRHAATGDYAETLFDVLVREAQIP
jgi:hypothetical protein